MARRNNNNCSFGFKRVTEAFNEIARARICSQSNNITSTGSRSTDRDHQHSAASNINGNININNSSSSSSPELSDLIESFIERSTEDNYEGEDKAPEITTSEEDDDDDDDDDEHCCRFVLPDTKEMLKDLLKSKHDDDDVVKVQIMNNIRAETELACRLIGTTTTTTSPQGFKRGLVTRLRDRGFDSGLCKSHWDKMAGFPSGDYEYVDVIVAGTRYVIEVSLAGEFSIARPTNHYLTLLGEFPQIYVGKAEELKKVVKIMCAAAKESLKNRDMHLPPWRRIGYMEAKWFGFYKRITTSCDVDVELMMRNKKQVSDSGKALTDKCTTEGIQVSPLMIFNYRCGGEVAGKVGFRVGNLAQAFGGRGIVSNGMEL